MFSPDLPNSCSENVAGGEARHAEAQSATALNMLLEQIALEGAPGSVRIATVGLTAGISMLLGNWQKTVSLINNLAERLPFESRQVSQSDVQRTLETISPIVVACAVSDYPEIIRYLTKKIRERGELQFAAADELEELRDISEAVRVLASFSLTDEMNEVLNLGGNPVLARQILFGSFCLCVRNETAWVKNQRPSLMTLRTLAEVANNTVGHEMPDASAECRSIDMVLRAFVKNLEGSHDACERLLLQTSAPIRHRSEVAWLFGYSLGARIRAETNLSIGPLLRRIDAFALHTTSQRYLSEAIPAIAHGIISANPKGKFGKVASVLWNMRDLVEERTIERTTLEAARCIHKVMRYSASNDRAKRDKVLEVVRGNCDTAEKSAFRPDIENFAPVLLDTFRSDLLSSDPRVRYCLANALVDGLRDEAPNIRSCFATMLNDAGFRSQAIRLGEQEPRCRTVEVLSAIRGYHVPAVESERLSPSCILEMVHDLVRHSVASGEGEVSWGLLATELAKQGLLSVLQEIVAVAKPRLEGEPGALHGLYTDIFWGLAAGPRIEPDADS